MRKQSFGVGVERTFPLHSPKIERIEVATRGDVRRAKLYYLRGRIGKRARVRERRPNEPAAAGEPEVYAAVDPAGQTQNAVNEDDAVEPLTDDADRDPLGDSDSGPGFAWQERGGPFLTANDVMGELSISAADLQNLIKSLGLIQLPRMDDQPLFPAWQFSSMNAEQRAFLAQLHNRLVTIGDISPWSAASWFVTGHPGLDGLTPVEWLVIDRPQGLLEQLARRDATRLAPRSECSPRPRPTGQTFTNDHSSGDQALPHS